MNDDPEDARFENELRAMRLVAPSKQLEERIAGVIGTPVRQPATTVWWQRLGFACPLAALGWGVASPVTAVAVALITVHLQTRPPLPSPPSPRANAAGLSEQRGNLILPGKETPGILAANVPEAAFDEGVVPDGGRGMAHRVRYRSTDLVQWRNPRSGAQWEVSYPREDVLLVPINAE